MTSSPEGRQEAAVLDAKALEAARAAYRKAEENPHLVSCQTCGGRGDADGDWCDRCGGCGYDLAEGEENRPLNEAIGAYLSTLIPAKPAMEVVEALEVAREEIVIAIAFLGRDAGTSRIDRTIESLINRLVKTDQLAQAALQASATPDAQTEVEK